MHSFLYPHNIQTLSPTQIQPDIKQIVIHNHDKTRDGTYDTLNVFTFFPINQGLFTSPSRTLAQTPLSSEKRVSSKKKLEIKLVRRNGNHLLCESVFRFLPLLEGKAVIVKLVPPLRRRVLRGCNAGVIIFHHHSTQKG